MIAAAPIIGRYFLLVRRRSQVVGCFVLDSDVANCMLEPLKGVRHYRYGPDLNYIDKEQYQTLFEYGSLTPSGFACRSVRLSSKWGTFRTGFGLFICASG